VPLPVNRDGETCILLLSCCLHAGRYLFRIQVLCQWVLSLSVIISCSFRVEIRCHEMEEDPVNHSNHTYSYRLLSSKQHTYIS
jgi:hypothetical protein